MQVDEQPLRTLQAAETAAAATHATAEALDRAALEAAAAAAAAWDALIDVSAAAAAAAAAETDEGATKEKKEAEVGSAAALTLSARVGRGHMRLLAGATRARRMVRRGAAHAATRALGRAAEDDRPPA